MQDSHENYDPKYRVVRYVAAALLVTAVLIVSAALFISAISRMVEQDTQANLQALTEKNTEHVRMTMLEELRALEVQAEFIASFEDIQDPLVISILKEEVVRFNYLRAGVLLPDGSSRNTSGEDNNLAYRDYFKQAMQGTSVISDVLDYSLDPSLEVIAFAVPIQKGDRVVGVLRGLHAMREYADLLDLSMLDGQGHAHIIRPDGTMLYTETGDEHPLFNGKPFTENPDFQGNESLRAMAQAILAGTSGLIKVDLPKGADVYVDYRPLGINDWYVVSFVPASSIMARISNVVRIASGTILILVVVFLYILVSFIIAKERKQRELERIAFTDELTGMGNWEKLKFQLGPLLALGGLKGHAYVLIDVDNFRVVNEIAGYTVANQLLKEIAAVLHSAIQNDEYAIRIINDRFALLVKCTGPGSLESRMQTLLHNLGKIQDKAEFGKLKGRPLVFSCGIHVIDDTRTSLDSIHELATIAHDSIKHAKHSSLAFYDQNMHLASMRTRELEERFESALEHGEFCIHLQPVFNVVDQDIAGAEVLVRWNHPIRGMVSPGEFIPLLEGNGMLDRLDTWVFKEACRVQKSWMAQGRQGLYLSVNVSRGHLLSAGFVESYVDSVHELGLECRMFNLEITETAFIDAPARIEDVLTKLHSFGFMVSIDDFGTGYSSLNLLYNLTIDLVKIDRQLLLNLKKSGKAQTVLSSMLHMIKKIDMGAVAEGVETTEQLEFLKSVGCPMAQGYLYAKPMPVDQFERFWDQKIQFAKPH
jgi:diguanylate cyclase (GGDEF)-like protein